MKQFLALIMMLVVVGCRQEDWRTTSLALPHGMSSPEAIARITALDTQTPPEVTVSDGYVKVRYNSMHLAIKNIEYALR